MSLIQMTKSSQDPGQLSIRKTTSFSRTTKCSKVILEIDLAKILPTKWPKQLTKATVKLGAYQNFELDHQIALNNRYNK